MIPVVSDISGIAAIKSKVNIQDIDASGKVFVVTGGHAGIGLATTRALAKSGARVILASRTPSKARGAIDDLVREDSAFENRLDFVQLDLSSLKQVRAAAEQLLEREQRLDGIINNAGVMAVPYELTEDGIEQQFQVNHLSHWLFTKILMPLLERTAESTGHPARVVNLSSFAHTFISAYPRATPSFKSLEDVNRPFEHSGWIRYSQAKLCAILFSRELNKRSNARVRSVAVHPGFVTSDLYSSTRLKVFLKLFIPVQDGALSSVYAAASPEVENKDLWGSYFVPFGKVKSTTAYGNDSEMARDLWDLCEQIVQDKVGSV